MHLQQRGTREQRKHSHWRLGTTEASESRVSSLSLDLLLFDIISSLIFWPTFMHPVCRLPRSMSIARVHFPITSKSTPECKAQRYSAASFYFQPWSAVSRKLNVLKKSLRCALAFPLSTVVSLASPSFRAQVQHSFSRQASFRVFGAGNRHLYLA